MKTGIRFDLILMPSIKLSIVIVSYNVQDLLKNCLQSILDCQPPSANYELVVVDNHSVDESVEMVKKEFPQVKLITSEENLGFGRANNLGAKKTKGELILFLNPDTKVCSESLESLAGFFEDRPRAGIVGPQLLNEDDSFQPSVGEYPSVLSLIWEKPIDFLERRFSFLRPFLGRLLVKYQRFKKLHRVDWVTGAALACRREVWEELGGFDEKFFMYFEDIDFCLRAKEKDWGVYYFPESKIYHLRGKSQPAKSRKKARAYYQSQDYYFRKNKGRFYSGLVKIVRWPYQVLDLRTKVGRYY